MEVGVAQPLRQRYLVQLIHTVVHFALNFVNVLFLKAIKRSQRIFSLSNKLGEALFNHERWM